VKLAFGIADTIAKLGPLVAGVSAVIAAFGALYVYRSVGGQVLAQRRQAQRKPLRNAVALRAFAPLREKYSSFLCKAFAERSRSNLQTLLYLDGLHYWLRLIASYDYASLGCGHQEIFSPED
jgi:hypothetical protein